MWVFKTTGESRLGIMWFIIRTYVQKSGVLGFNAYRNTNRKAQRNATVTRLATGKIRTRLGGFKTNSDYFYTAEDFP